MKQMFESATVKLTAWYLIILMSISLLFSYVIYQVSISELDTRLSTFQIRVDSNPAISGYDPRTFETFKTNQLDKLEVNLFFALSYANLAILIGGGIGSYLLARRSLRPIEEAHESVSRFTSDASHELRTPLAVMKSELEVALRDPRLTKADMRELLESNLEEVDRLSDLSHMLLQISRQDYADLKREEVNLSKLASQAIKAVGKDGKRIMVSMPDKPLKIAANEAGLSELMMIVLDNALRYSPPDSTVMLRLSGTDQAISIETQNDGAGIHPDDLPHIFERFYRADKSRNSGEKSGYGLGLSLAKKIVELHGGSIEISSQPQSTTSVRISLPQSR